MSPSKVLALTRRLEEAQERRLASLWLLLEASNSTVRERARLRSKATRPVALRPAGGRTAWYCFLVVLACQAPCKCRSLLRIAVAGEIILRAIAWFGIDRSGRSRGKRGQFADEGFVPILQERSDTKKGSDEGYSLQELLAGLRGDASGTNQPPIGVFGSDRPNSSCVILAGNRSAHGGLRGFYRRYFRWCPNLDERRSK